MSSATWIKVVISSKDEKVLRISEITGEDPYTVVGRCVDWFRWVDEHLSGPTSSLRSGSLNHLLGNPKPRAGLGTYLDAFIEIGWVKIKDGCIEVCSFDSHFGASAKQRAMAQKRQEKHRVSRSERDKSNGSVDGVRNGSSNGEALPNRQPEENRIEEKREEVVTPVVPLGKEADDGAFRAAWDALSKWSEVCTRFGIAPGHNHERGVSDLLLALDGQPPIIHGEKAVPQRLLVALAVEKLIAKGKPFKRLPYACACIKGELDDWAKCGAPGQGIAKPVYVDPTAGKEERRKRQEDADRAAAEAIEAENKRRREQAEAAKKNGGGA